VVRTYHYTVNMGNVADTIYGWRWHCRFWI